MGGEKGDKEGEKEGEKEGMCFFMYVANIIYRLELFLQSVIKRTVKKKGTATNENKKKGKKRKADEEDEDEDEEEDEDEKKDSEEEEEKEGLLNLTEVHLKYVNLIPSFFYLLSFIFYLLSFVSFLSSSLSFAYCICRLMLLYHYLVQYVVHGFRKGFKELDTSIPADLKGQIMRKFKHGQGYEREEERKIGKRRECRWERRGGQRCERGERKKRLTKCTTGWNRRTK